MTSTKKGLLYGIGAYGLWGFLPIYWKSLQAVPALEILTHRMVWSLAFIAALLAYRGHWRWLGQALRNRRIVLTFFAAACLLTVNWGTYIWAVNAGFLVETSLGYFINPLVNVLLGMIFFHERLRPGQGLAITVAAAGVLYLTFTYGHLPWIGLTLAFSFGFYGVLKKGATLGSVDGMFLETALLFLPALAYLGYLESSGGAAFGHVSWQTNLLLALTGVVTALPLILFSAAAPRLPLSTLGILQYSAPTIQFLLGVFLYNEPFTPARMVGFSLIWMALIIYSVEGVIIRRRRQATKTQQATI